MFCGRMAWHILNMLECVCVGVRAAKERETEYGIVFVCAHTRRFVCLAVGKWSVTRFRCTNLCRNDICLHLRPNAREYMCTRAGGARLNDGPEFGAEMHGNAFSIFLWAVRLIKIVIIIAGWALDDRKLLWCGARSAHAKTILIDCKRM